MRERVGLREKLKHEWRMFEARAGAGRTARTRPVRRGRGREGGRPAQVYSDPDASWGHRSAVSTRKGGGFCGYKIHAAVCAVTGLPLAWQVETAARNESIYVVSLLDAVRDRGFAPETVAMDMGYDNSRVYAECDAHGCAAIIPLRKNQGERASRIPRNSDEWRTLYRPAPLSSASSDG